MKAGFVLKCLNGHLLLEEEIPKAPVSAAVVWMALILADAHGLPNIGEKSWEALIQVVNLTLRQLDPAVSFDAIAEEADQETNSVFAVFEAIVRQNPGIFRPYE